MKTLTIAIFALAAVVFSNASFAQEVCEECTSPLLQSVGSDGLTCDQAAITFQKASGSKDKLATEHEGTLTYSMTSEVYCYPRFGNTKPGSASVDLTFHSTKTKNVTTDLTNIMGNSELESLNNLTTFTNAHGDACFSRYQLNAFQPHYFNYQCRIPETNDRTLICKIKYDGLMTIGYQVYQLNTPKK